MVYRNFPALEASAFNEDGHETMQTIESEQRRNDFALEDANSTAGVLEVGFQCFAAKPSGHSGGALSHESVLSISAPAANKVGIAEFLHQSREVCRVILQVSVERGDERSICGVDAGPDCRALSAVPVEANAFDAGLCLAGGLDFFPCRIAAVIIHKHEFPVIGQPRKCCRDFIRHGLDVVLFIEDGNDYGDSFGHDV